MFLGMITTLLLLGIPPSQLDQLLGSNQSLLAAPIQMYPPELLITSTVAQLETSISQLPAFCHFSNTI
jgi:hypothetical protein